MKSLLTEAAQSSDRAGAIRSQIRRASLWIERLLTKRQTFRNREGHVDFDFALAESRETGGVSAILRAKDEQEKIYYSLISIYQVFDEIVVVDNGSKDNTLRIVNQFKQQRDEADKIKVLSYPFSIARCGSEHFHTPEDSVHSLVYYYNWTLSHCSLRYVCKWDADMILRKDVRNALKHFLAQIQIGKKKTWKLSGQTVYRDLRGRYYLSKEEINQDLMIFPYGYNCRFHKCKHFECLKCRPKLPKESFDGVTFYELKFLSEDEFSHWSTREFPTVRKRIEWRNFKLFAENDGGSSAFEELPSSSLLEIEDEVSEMAIPVRKTQ